DNDLDQMGIFYDKQWPDEKDDITVWWAVDVGDDNLLWYDVNGNYYQDLCQWRTHFSGDELFYQFRITSEDERWLNMYEDPFAFYDLDGDLASELVIRITAVGYDVQNLRYSIDADDDAGPDNVHNYDFSITALPPEEGISSEFWDNEVYTIRGIETHPVLPWDKTKEFAQKAAWGKAMFIWDEVNSNTDGNVDEDPNERWEGLLNHKSKLGDFPQVGGPPCSTFNKRTEVSHKPGSPLRLYFDETDQRFHLVGAKYGYLDIDYNFDGVLDAAYTWKDEDGDGHLDVRSADVDADGTVDFEQELGTKRREVDLEFSEISSLYPAVLQDVLRGSQHFIDAASREESALPESAGQVAAYYRDTLPAYHLEREIGVRIQNSPAGARFYLDLMRDRLYAALKSKEGHSPGWTEVSHVYLAGRYGEAAKQLAALRGAEVLPASHFRPLQLDGQTYQRRVPVIVSLQDRDASSSRGIPVVIDLQTLRKHAVQDFNPQNCVVVAGDLWLDWRVVPHQVDDWDFGGEGQLVFLATVAPGSEQTYFVYDAPAGTRAPDHAQRTRAVLDTPAYVAWESDAGAFRFYTGQFDFFGKVEDRLLPRAERLLYPIVGEDYHAEQAWGIDALHVGKTSGLGGLTLYVDGKEYPVQSPAGEGHVQFEHRVLGAGPIRSAVEIVAKNVFPETPEQEVRLRCFSYAGHPESEVHVLLPPAHRKDTIAPGLLKLEEEQSFTDEKLGVLGTWGRQGDDIGEIGLAVAVPPAQVERVLELGAERRLLSRTEAQADRRLYDFRYWIIGTWRRGMQYPITSVGEHWQRTISELARVLRAEGVLMIDKVQTAKGHGE
ncbi:MAG: DUF4861 family protein, partial [Candidatus Hydrogenedentes bacterium]|nr:DUF4861 family protein [Candidatus Hydrogenedentota bacterium]